MKKNCSICGELKKIRVENIGIAFGWAGYDIDICIDCSKLTVDQMFKKLAKKLNLCYPFKYVKK